MFLLKHIHYLGLLLPLATAGQPASTGKSAILEGYIREGLANNLALRQESLEIRPGIGIAEPGEIIVLSARCFQPHILISCWRSTVGVSGRRFTQPSL